jgi:hypothetical protein
MRKSGVILPLEDESCPFAGAALFFLIKAALNCAQNRRVQKGGRIVFHQSLDTKG